MAREESVQSIRLSRHVSRIRARCAQVPMRRLTSESRCLAYPLRGFLHLLTQIGRNSQKGGLVEVTGLEEYEHLVRVISVAQHVPSL